MARYLIERTFLDGWGIPVSAEGAAACHSIIVRNGELDVTWIHSYLSEDTRRSFCLYDGPNPEAIRKAAERTALPIDRITKVSVLDPYFYR